MADSKLEIILAAKDTASKTLQTFQGRITALTTSVFSLQGGLISLAGGGALGALTKSLTTTGMKVARLDKAYAEIAGSAEAASREFDFLRTTSDQLGQNFYAMADAYKGLAAASKGTALEGQATRDIFVAVTKASASLGLSADDTRGALNAIQQMMSKGKVSAEELRQQLGERLPGAFNLMAEAMGVSTAELDKMLQDGKVLAEDALPRLAQVLSGRYSGALDDATRASNKMEEAWTDLRATMAQSGFLDSVANAMTDIADTIKDPNVQQGLADFAKNLGSILATMAELAKYAGLRSVTATFGQAVELSQQGLLDLTEFARMGFVERQRLVDDILAKQSQINGGVFTGKIGPGTPGYAGYAGTAPTMPTVTATAYAIPGQPYYAGVEQAMLERSQAGYLQSAIPDYQKTLMAYEGDQVGKDSWQLAAEHQSAMDTMADKTTETAGVMADAFAGWATAYSSTLTDMLWDANLTFDGILESFGKMLTQMVIQRQMAGISEGLFADGGLLAGIFHAGGVVGQGGVSRSVSPYVFAGAPRLHGGLASDEFPAILQRGETVLPKNTTVATPKIDIVVNEAPAGTQVKQQQTGDVTQIIIDVAKADIARNGKLGQALAQTYGLNRRGY